MLLEYIDEDDQRRKTGADSSNVCGSSTWQDPLTAGVGTASYAAPEQVVSRDYGTAADIFSLGLILLELLCCFSTEHERLQTFYDCRHRRKLPGEFDEYPVVAQTVLACTEPKPERRPGAADLKKASSRLSSCRHAEPAENDTVASLKQQLAAKEDELKECKGKLETKDRIIRDLQRQLSSSYHGGPRNRPFHPPKEVDADCGVPASPSSSSSEDGI